MPDVDQLLGEWMAEELAREPVVAGGLGLEGFDDRLGDFSAARWSGQADRDRHWAARLAGVDLAASSVDQQVDVTAVLAELAGRSVMDDWQAWRRDPTLYVDPCLRGIFRLWLDRLRPEAELVAASVARLRQVPDVLAEARANLDAGMVPRLLAERAADGVRGGVSYLADQLPAEVEAGPQRDALAGAGRAAAEALGRFGRDLDDLAGRAGGDWAIGEVRYSGLLRDRELLGVTAAELGERGEAAYAALDAEMTELAAQIDPAASGWQEVVARLDRECPDTPEAMLAAYAESCRLARAFLVERDLVTLPAGERCLVEPSPLFQRATLAVASYSEPPPFSTSTTGHFFVPFPPEGESPEGVRQRLASNGHHAIPTTAVHEAYPGHHWQLTWAGATTRPVRKLLKTPYFYEGWALYAERLMHEQGFFADPRVALSHLAARIFRAARIVVDTSLHCATMTFDDAVRFMQDKALLTEPVAVAEVRRYCAWPTQAASYLTGALEIEAARDRWTAESRGSLKAFHDAIASSPGLPVALATRLAFT